MGERKALVVGIDDYPTCFYTLFSYLYERLRAAAQVFSCLSCCSYHHFPKIIEVKSIGSTILPSL